MIYEYRCYVCKEHFDIWKPVSQAADVEHCENCDKIMDKVYSKTHLIGTKVNEAYFHPAFGKVVKNDSEARELAKRKGLVEVGNEDVKKHVKAPKSDYDIGSNEFHEMFKVNAGTNTNSN